jgi:hypothetical protein
MMRPAASLLVRRLLAFVNSAQEDSDVGSAGTRKSLRVAALLREHLVPVATAALRGLSLDDAATLFSGAAFTRGLQLLLLPKGWGVRGPSADPLALRPLTSEKAVITAQLLEAMAAGGHVSLEVVGRCVGTFAVTLARAFK